MEEMKQISLKQTFVRMVIITVALILLCTALSIYGCICGQKYLLPDSDMVWLVVKTVQADGKVSEMKQRFAYNDAAELVRLEADDEGTEREASTSYTIERIENSFSALTPKRKAAYRTLSAAMVILPIIYSVSGVTLCAWCFYRKKLQPPLHILSEATEHICNRDLDFQVCYDSRDEMGKLCIAFEQMRKELYQNNQELWGMIEERKELQASVAHDLRNPIAILKGYTEYLQMSAKNGKLKMENVAEISDHLVSVANRMEQYTDSMKTISNLEAMEMNREECDLDKLLEEVSRDFRIVARQKELQFSFHPQIEERMAFLDCQMFYRILENIFMNAARYAKTSVQMGCSIEDEKLKVWIEDDGVGFQEEVLRKLNKKMFVTTEQGEHYGMGLAISRILCQKAGGSCEAGNGIFGGGRVEITIPVS